MAVDYCSVGNVVNYLDLSPGDEPLLESLITAVSRAFDIATGRTFGATADTSRTYYTGMDTDGDDLIFDQPFTSITSIVNGDSDSLTSSEYILFPRDVPYRRATLTPGGSVCWTDWNSSTFNGIVVTGKVGYPLNADVRQAVALWVAFMYKQKDNPLIDITAIEAGAVIQTPMRPPFTTNTIEKYKDRGASG